ncbi:hypothetical protein [Streptomyces buecherae]|uniref:Uncharacterized protein n=1 Tax=Streptomyces buecherae TaxID=2763006 RepID=A0A7H8N180_9ACTN|nr:hypothetical protein [Streptomyces buecherae]QKW48235.1 hypothetical protein HUT08_00265 [Streptomyces buecherae]QKW54095.1 hypothetical protein HUT08_36160 [Streptomyces buecherae]
MPGLTGRVWTVAEVCSACARAIPRSHVLKRSIQQDTSSPLAETAVRRDVCAVCVQEASSPLTGMRSTAGEEGARATGQGLRPAQAARLEPALRYLGDVGGGRTSQGRLLALLALLHPSGMGGIRLTAEGLSAQHADLTEVALQELAEGDWLRRVGSRPASCAGGREEVWAVADAERGLVDVPLLPAHEHLVVHDWVCRLIGHALLLGQPAEVRLAAVCLTARATFHGRGNVGLRSLARMCAFDSPTAGAAALNALRATGWVNKLHANSGWKQPATYFLGEAARLFLAPPGTPVPESSAVPTKDWDFAVAAWVHAFERRHRHPPALRDVLAFHCQQDSSRPWSSSQLKAAVDSLQRESWLEIGEGVKQWVRPGRRYWRHLRASKAKACKRHALSPRQEESRGRSVNRPIRARQPVGVSPHGHGPALPLGADRPGKPPPPSTSTSASSAVPAGIWLLPGARAVLAPDPS